MDKYVLDQENPQTVWHVRHRSSIIEDSIGNVDLDADNTGEDVFQQIELSDLSSSRSSSGRSKKSSVKSQSSSKRYRQGKHRSRSNQSSVRSFLKESTEIPHETLAEEVCSADTGDNESSGTIFSNENPEVCKLELHVHPDDEQVTDDERTTGTVTRQFLIFHCLEKAHESISDYYSEHKTVFKFVFFGILAALYCSYFVYALVLDFKRAAALIIGTSLFLYIFIVVKTWRHFGGDIKDLGKPCLSTFARHSAWLKWCLVALLALAVITFLVFDVGMKAPSNFICLLGLFTFVFLLFVFSKHPSKVKWRPVAAGITLQFFLGLFILRVPFGLEMFRFLGDQVAIFFTYSDAGAKFVFGDPTFLDHFFAFKILPVIVFFSTIISILYYIGVMQLLIIAISSVMRTIMKTTAAESLNSAANIFIGQTEAPLLIKPFLPEMTKSELHAVMTGGFATIAGGVLAAYISFGVNATHLISASVMTAPGALAISKLFYPEVEQSKMSKISDIKMPDSSDRNIIEAASAGASASIKIVAHIGANLIGFLSVLAFVNAALSYFGSLVDYPQLSFEVICSYLFRPFAYLMGVQWQDCDEVAELLGVKTFLNEFIAYDRLGVLIRNFQNGTDPQISERSATITTYALCGFANLGSIGVTLGGLGAMAPSRKGDLASMALRALISGTVACFISACIAGLLIPAEINAMINNFVNNSISTIGNSLPDDTWELTTMISSAIVTVPNVSSQSTSNITKS